METPIAEVDVFDYLMTLIPSEETLRYGDGQRRIRRLTLTLDYAQPALQPLPLYQQLSTKTPGVLYESVDISRVYGRYSLAVVDAPCRRMISPAARTSVVLPRCSTVPCRANGGRWRKTSAYSSTTSLR
jgi:hypothetical protein